MPNLPLPVQLNHQGESSLVPPSFQLTLNLNSPPPLSLSTLSPNIPIELVWDNEDVESDDRDLQTGNRSPNHIKPTMERVAKIQQILSALCANWENTAPSTVSSTLVQYVNILKLGIYLKTAVTDEGLVEL
ncbi:hypothetical protein Moror_4870 [Moniliophthora roreri MCA 2997]|uniref:Uncharacterized protein n=1 Tax=Moniliophthora roreri (strain MCA 2997) TaxID=1381753 RepID=V2WPJ5_MONRO|nr:hypothetical protein Moror_4870 [Moniliophthora roreri MCA 2997]